ncbi:hypothetical protein [Acidocella facilis]|uniref:hypothetical protein n=1 Tax=Acidocella facilis TaxID=525 RepID=UPI001F323245|nr:hypothetical protein [Acidocella facilis]
MKHTTSPPAPESEPSLQPRGMAPLSLAYFCLTVTDLCLAGGMVAQWAAPLDRAGMAPFIGSFVGFPLALIYMVYPTGGLRGRNMTALAAYRLVLRLLLIVHLPLLALAGLNAWSGGRTGVFIALPGAILATAGLYPIARALQGMHWLNPAARPEDFESLIGVDEPPAPPEHGTGPSLFIPCALPFLPAFKAGRYVLAGAALCIWLAGIGMIWRFPIGIALPVVLLVSILWQQASYRMAYGGDSSLLAAPPLSEAAKIARRPVLARIFTPERLRPAPLCAPLGRLALPLLIVLDYFALVTLIALQTAGAFSPFLEEIATASLGLVPLMFALLPVMAIIARGGNRLYAILGAFAAVIEIAMALLAAAASFRIPLGALNVTVPPPVYPVIRPLTWLLLAGLPLALALLLSLLPRRKAV